MISAQGLSILKGSSILQGLKRCASHARKNYINSWQLRMNPDITTPLGTHFDYQNHRSYQPLWLMHHYHRLYQPRYLSTPPSHWHARMCLPPGMNLGHHHHRLYQPVARCHQEGVTGFAGSLTLPLV